MNKLIFCLQQTCLRFNYMAISDDIQRYMPSAADRDEPHGTPLAYKEAVLLTNPKEPQFKGEVNRPKMLDILYSNKLKFQTETEP